MKSLRLRILHALMPLTRAAGKMHVPYSKRSISGYHYYELVRYLEPGMVVVTKKFGEMTNWLIPGDYTHAAMYCGEMDQVHYVVEAIDPYTVDTDLVSFILSKDRIGIYEPLFATRKQMADAATFAAKCAVDSAPYDYLFQPGDKSFYCAELVWQAYREVVGSAMPFVKRRTMGVDTILPQDFANAGDKWRKVWASEDLPPRSAIRRLKHG